MLFCAQPSLVLRALCVIIHTKHPLKIGMPSTPATLETTDIPLFSNREYPNSPKNTKNAGIPRRKKDTNPSFFDDFKPFCRR
jgi:hypothetical protein